MRHRWIASVVALGVAANAALVGQQGQDAPRFRSGVSLVLVDVVVRDRSGAVVKGLTADDFELLEDGARQQIVTFAFEEITPNAAPVDAAATTTLPASPSPDPPTHPLTSSEVSGHRLLTLVFDTSSMQPEDVEKA